MSLLCLIPARGGSKGVPRKNLRVVGGRPLIAWTIDAAMSARADLRVVVSTDDDEIAEIALAHGAEVPFRRPAELAGDATTTEAVVIHALDALANGGPDADATVLLQPTSPVRLPGTLDRAIAQFEESGADSLVGVVPMAPFLWHHPAHPVAEYDYAARPMRQQLLADDYRYRETGSIYITKNEVYRRESCRLGGFVSLFVTDEVESIDVDTELDLVLAGAVLDFMKVSRP